MNISHLSTKVRSVVAFAVLGLPACIGAPGDDVAGATSVETRQAAYKSVPPPTQDDNDPGGGSSSGGGSTSGPPSLSVTFETCTNDTRRNEMRDALDDILDNWSAFENNLEARGVTSDHDCMYNRLTDNGKVHCDVCDLAGHSVWLGNTAHVCRSWATDVESLHSTSAERRKICWASVIMHEFGHTCVRFEDGAESIDNAARETLNDLYGQSLDLDSECNQD